MLVVVIPVTDWASAADALAQMPPQVGGVELRLDYLPVLDIGIVRRLRDACRVPIIFTLRSQAQGGKYAKDEAQRLKDIVALCALEPEFVDLEYDVPESLVRTIRDCYPAIDIIISYHQFDHTPKDLLTLLHRIERSGNLIYKIATYACSSLDGLRMVQFVRQHHHYYRLIGLCMGEDGACTRILSRMMGNFLSYAYQDAATAPGQLSVDHLITQYHYDQINTETRLYALLGDPVSQSVGHILHNQAIRLLQRNAVYLKLRVTEAELPDMLVLCRGLPLDGLSITMPLKESMVVWMDKIESTAQPINAVNSMLRQRSQWLGFNTDGLGAIQVLKHQVPIAQQIILILGAGGTARAIAYEALQQSAQVIILNRTLARAQALAKDLGVEGYALTAFPELKTRPYTVIVNTLPEHAYIQPEIAALFHSDHIRRNTLVMDCVYQPLETTFLRLLKKAHCLTIPGFQMFVGQALLQIEHWFQPEPRLLQQIKLQMEQFFM
jgi:3-dehydroquinate dehydratase/shikimate dehydrogenase